MSQQSTAGNKFADALKLAYGTQYTVGPSARSLCKYTYMRIKAINNFFTKTITMIVVFVTMVGHLIMLL